jgi:hypothetical protein
METIEAMAERGANMEPGTEAGMELSGDDRNPSNPSNPSKTKAPSSTGRFESRVHALGSPPR